MDFFVAVVPLRHRRSVHFCTWLVSGFHMGPRRPKKPYNSLLGEVFRAALQAPDGSLIGTYVAEQVSHHPPVSAFHYADRPGGVIVWGHAEMRSRFLGNSAVAAMDHEGTKLNLECTALAETYEFNFPDLYGRGILIRPLVAEIVGTVRVRCLQTGVSAQVQFLAKPFFRGRYNCIRGFVAAPDGTTVVTFDGRWSAYMRVRDSRTGNSWLSFDVRSAQPLTVMRPPIVEQGEFESEFIWQKVSERIERGDLRGATAHKAALEEKQRKERAMMESENLQWECQAFHWSGRLKRWVPNALNIDPWRDGEEPPQMPPPFARPAIVQAAYDAGVTAPIHEVHAAVEAEIGP